LIPRSSTSIAHDVLITLLSRNEGVSELRDQAKLRMNDLFIPLPRAPVVQAALNRFDFYRGPQAAAFSRNQT
jgi:hypothetical protein